MQVKDYIPMLNGFSLFGLLGKILRNDGQGMIAAHQ